MRMKTVIFEDDERRASAMLDRLRDRFFTFEHHVFASSHEMIRFLEEHLAEAIAISLDHDLPLYRDEHGELHDLGTGREVADYLATKRPACPIIIHSTNAPAAAEMKDTLERSGWTTHRVTPYDDLKWIDEI